MEIYRVVFCNLTLTKLCNFLLISHEGVLKKDTEVVVLA